MGGEADLTEGLISKEHGKNKWVWQQQAANASQLERWGTGHRAVQIGAGVPLPQDLSASSPSTLWHYLKKKEI